jgi:hypothetical protein
MNIWLQNWKTADFLKKINDIQKYPNPNWAESKRTSMIAYIRQEMLEQLPKYSMWPELVG